MTGSGHICLKQERTQGMSTHVHVLLDNSGSMAGSRSRLAVSCCHALASACVPIKGLSVAVTAFNDAGSKCLVFPLLKPEQRLHANMQIRPEGGTSLAPALWWAMQQMLFVKKSKKILFITDEKWAIIGPMLAKVSTKIRGRKRKDNRLMFNTILWSMKTGAPWRDLHPEFGH